MKLIRSFGIALVCCAILVSGQVAEKKDEDPTTTTVAPSTTEAPTTTSTSKTTTASPETTTPSTTTSAPAPAPVPTTPAPAPVPVYPRNMGNWSVEDGSDVTCIMLKGAMQIVVIDENITETVNIPGTATATGSCNEPQHINLTWEGAENKKNRLTLSFEKNNSTKGGVMDGITDGKFGLQNVTVELHLTSNATNTTDKVKKQILNIATFQTPFKHSYTCLAEEVLKSSTGDFSLKIREVRVEAYRQTPAGNKQYSTAVQCAADDATDVVPIAVGAALAGLVVIVLIAYLIGRRRSRARGYQSV